MVEKGNKMAVVYKCDNCGKEAKHGDEWLSVSVRQQSIRDERYSQAPEESLEVEYFPRRPTLTCSVTCAFTMIVKQAKKVQMLMEDIVSNSEMDIGIGEFQPGLLASHNWQSDDIKPEEG